MMLKKLYFQIFSMLNNAELAVIFYPYTFIPSYFKVILSGILEKRTNFAISRNIGNIVMPEGIRTHKAQ